MAGCLSRWRTAAITPKKSRPPEGFKLDSTPHYFTVANGKTTTLTVTNKAFSGILIRKIDSVTRKGIYGVTFVLYDGNMRPVDQFTTDQNGIAYVDDLGLSGKVYLRELNNKGYIPDEQLKTVYVKPGQTTEITWENTPITAQIQITKKSADYNSTNGLPAGTPLEGAIFEIRDRAGNLVDTIRSDSRGMAASRPLPLERYTIREVKAPDHYGINETELSLPIWSTRGRSSALRLPTRASPPACPSPRRAPGRSWRDNRCAMCSLRLPTAPMCASTIFIGETPCPPRSG